MLKVDFEKRLEKAKAIMAEQKLDALLFHSSDHFQCGNIRYRINGEPLTLYACHCLDCQAQSSSAFGLSMWVNFDNFELQQGVICSTEHPEDFYDILTAWKKRGNT